MVGCGLLKASFCPSIQIMLTFRDPVQPEHQEGGGMQELILQVLILAAVYFRAPILLCRRRRWSKNRCVRIVLLLPRTPQELVLITRQSRRHNKDKTVQNKTPIDFLWGFRVIKRAQTLFENPGGKPFAWCSQRFAPESIMCTFIYIYIDTEECPSCWICCIWAVYQKKRALNTNRLKALCIFQTWHMQQRLVSGAI